MANWHKGKPKKSGLYLVCVMNMMHRKFYMVDYWWITEKGQHWALNQDVLAYMRFPFYDDDDIVNIDSHVV